MKQLITAALLAFSFALPGAFAQTSTPSGAQRDPAAAAAVKEFMDAMKLRDMLQMSFAQMQQNLPQIMRQVATSAINANPKLNAAQKKKAFADADKALPKAVKAFSDTMNDPKLIDELIDETVPLYARHFNADELRVMAAFYRTPVGVKVMQVMPQLMAESMQISQRVMMPRMTAMIEKLVQGKM